MNILKDRKIQLFECLQPWEQLSLETRRLFLEIIGEDLQAHPEDFSTDQLAELRSVNFLKPDSSFLYDELRPLKELFDSMYRHRHFDHENPEPPLAYVKEHFTIKECQDTRVGYNRRDWRNYQTLAEDAASKYWISSFLDCTDYREWQPRISSDQTMRTKEEFSVIQQWVEQLIDGPNPQPMIHLLEAIDGNNQLAAQSLMSALRMLLLFPAIDGQTLRPVVGVWPKVYTKWHQPPMARPKPIPLSDGNTIFATPVLLHDITSLLITASTEGLRLKKNSEDLFKKEQQRVEENMLVLPEWPGYPVDKEQRCKSALRWLIQSKYVSTKRSLLTDIAAGRRWLAGTESQRLKALHDTVRSMRRCMTRGHYLSRDELSFMPNNPQQSVRSGAINLEDYVEKAFSDLPVEEWFDLETYLCWCSESRNPFKVKEAERTIGYQLWEYYQHDDEYREKRWQPFLLAFLLDRLLPLGGAKLALTSENKLMFSLTPAGSYLLGTTDVFEYEIEQAEGTILVQPDFTVIFTAPNISAETALIPFSKRIGQGVGTLFKITPESIQSALHADMTGDQIIETLTHITSNPPPQNVLQQIRDWGRAYRKVRLKQIWMIDCPDKETAALIIALLPKNAESVTKTLVKLNASSKDVVRIKKKLKDNNIGFS